MSRKVSFYMTFYVFLFLCVTTAIVNTKFMESSPADLCSRAVGLDILKIEAHLAGLNLTDVPTVKMMTAGFKCPVSALPFGALKSDWSRLLLLRQAQPDDSILKSKLVSLMRILIVAYYQMEERFETIGSETQVPTQSPAGEATTVASAIGGAGESTFGSSVDRSSRTTVTSKDDDHQRPHYTTRSTLFVSGDNCFEGNATVNCKTTGEIATAKIPSLSSSRGLGETAGVFPIDKARQNITSSIEVAAVSARKVAAVRMLDDCLKQTLSDVSSRRNLNGTHDSVFERLKKKRRGDGEARAARHRRN